MGYSMGSNVALRAAIQHPEVVRKLVVVSIPFSRNGWYPEVRANIEHMGAAAMAFMKDTPMYQSYLGVAPEPEHFPMLLDKMGNLLRQDYDWSGEVALLKMPTLLVYDDADSISPAHAVAFFALLGGGKQDGSWDGSGMSHSQLAIWLGTTHYNSFASPLLMPIVTPFLDRSDA